MDRSTSLFWLLVLALLTASTYYGVGAWRQQATMQPREARLENGDALTLVRVIDADTVVLNKAGDGDVTVRLLGIKSLPSKLGKDEASVYGRAAEEALKRIVAERPLRALLNTPPRDRHGRTLATLYAGEQDIGLELVRRGHVLVYSVYPFAAMPIYLQQQNEARARHLGLWADAEVSAQADALIQQWSRQGG
mgnify:CR=1 FL=1